jgi:addiction module HigA family antidote
MALLVPANRRPITPGEVLREAFLKQLNMTQGRLANALGVDRTSVRELVDGRRKVTTEMSLRLAHPFRTSPQYSINLQIIGDLFDAAHSPLGAEINRLKVLVPTKSSGRRTSEKDAVKLPRRRIARRA